MAKNEHTTAPAMWQRLLLAVFALLSVRSATALANTRGDVIVESLVVPLKILAAVGLHSGGISLGILLMGYEFDEAWKVALVPAAALALLDIAFRHAADLSKADKIARDLRLDYPASMKGGLLGFLLRPMLSIVTGLVIGTFLTLYALNGDTNSVIAGWQAKDDAPRIEIYEAQVDDEVSVLEERVARARAELWRVHAVDPRTKANERLKTLVTDRSTTVLAISGLRAQRKQSAEAALHARNRMKCELDGAINVTCPDASGERGDGDLYDEAKTRAEAAETREKTLSREIALGHSRLTAIDTEITQLQATTPTSPAVTAAINAAAAGEDDLLAFDAQARLRDLVVKDPGRRVYDPNSFSNRLSAIAELTRENPKLLIFIAMLEALAIALESLVFVSSLVARPTEYHQARARLLILSHDRNQAAVQQSYLENSKVRRAFLEQIASDDPKVVKLNLDLARVRAREEAKREAHYQSELTKNTTARNDGIHGMAAE